MCIKSVNGWRIFLRITTMKTLSLAFLLSLILGSLNPAFANDDVEVEDNDYVYEESYEEEDANGQVDDDTSEDDEGYEEEQEEY